MNDLKPILAIAMIGIGGTPSVSSADGFGWYAYTVDGEFFTNLLDGGLNDDVVRLEPHVAGVVEDDLRSDNLPDYILNVRQTLRSVATSGVSLAPMDEKVAKYNGM